MTFIVLAFLALVVVGLARTWKFRATREAWQPWLACVFGALGIASVLFDTQIDAALGGMNWVFILETWSLYFAYTLMTETCRAVAHAAPVKLRGWIVGLVASWCATITILFSTLEGRAGTRAHFVRDMFPQAPSLAIALMYSLGVVILAVLPLYWLRTETGVPIWLIRIGTAMVALAHMGRLIISPIDFYNDQRPSGLEQAFYQSFVPIFYLGVASFAVGLIGLSLRRWRRERDLVQMHDYHHRALNAITRENGIDVRGATLVAHLVAIEDALRRGGGETFTPTELEQVASARAWLDRTHQVGSVLHDAAVLRA